MTFTNYSFAVINPPILKAHFKFKNSQYAKRACCEGQLHVIFYSSLTLIWTDCSAFICSWEVLGEYDGQVAEIPQRETCVLVTAINP